MQGTNDLRGTKKIFLWRTHGRWPSPIDKHQPSREWQDIVHSAKRARRPTRGVCITNILREQAQASLQRKNAIANGGIWMWGTDSIFSQKILLDMGIPVYKCIPKEVDVVLRGCCTYHMGFKTCFNIREVITCALVQWLPWAFKAKMYTS